MGLSLLLKNWLILEIGLREWARTNFDSINLHKLDILHEIKNLDDVKETCNFIESEHNKDYELRQTMRNILIQKEVYWHQCTSLTWLKEGDSNTKFFHIVANVRHDRNFISHIIHNQSTIEETREIRKAFTSLFRSQYGSKSSTRFRFNCDRLLINKARVDLIAPVALFT